MDSADTPLPVEPHRMATELQSGYVQTVNDYSRLVHHFPTQNAVADLKSGGRAISEPSLKASFCNRSAQS